MPGTIYVATEKLWLADVSDCEIVRDIECIRDPPNMYQDYALPVWAVFGLVERNLFVSARSLHSGLSLRIIFNHRCR